jgi:hypothetical protein
LDVVHAARTSINAAAVETGPMRRRLMAVKRFACQVGSRGIALRSPSIDRRPSLSRRALIGTYALRLSVVVHGWTLREGLGRVDSS